MKDFALGLALKQRAKGNSEIAYSDLKRTEFNKIPL